MKKRVWLVSHYAMPPQYEVRWKTLKYAQYLRSAGYDVLLVSASTIHNTDINLIQGKEKFLEANYDGQRFVHIKCDGYQGSGLKRIINMLQFSYRFKHVMKKFELPDVIVCDCNCVNYRGILSFAKKYGIKFVCEIRDLWPLSIVEYLGISAKNPVIRFLYGQEKRMYRLSDAIIFSMPGGKAYVADKGWDKIDANKIYYINNGIDLNDVKRNENEFPSDLPTDCFNVVYTGSIRRVNDLGILTGAAEQLADYPDVKFYIFGDGDERPALETECVRKGLTNVFFMGNVNKKFIPAICAGASVNVITVKASSLTKYGVSWNKLFDYMAAGKPIISTLHVNYDFIDAYNCGVSCETQDVETLVRAILSIYKLPRKEYDVVCANAAAAAKDFEYGALTDKLIGIIQNVTGEEKPCNS